MAELMPLDSVSRWRVFLIWWESWLGRLAIQLPWIIAAILYFVALGAGQGQSALESSVERPFTGIIIVGVLIGICSYCAREVAECHHLMVLRPRLTMFLGAWKADPKPGNALYRLGSLYPLVYTGRFPARACLIVCVGVFAAGVMTVADVSEGAASDFLLLPVFALSILAGSFAPLVMTVAFILLRRALLSLFGTKAIGHIDGFVPLICSLLIYGIGIYLVSYHFDVLAGIGPHAILAAGLFSIAILFMAICHLLMTRGSLRAVWLLIAVVVTVHLLQAALVERPNPLLNEIPAVERAATECGRLSSAATAAGQSASSRTPSSILISAEGGGIRAAYWTALSLEELSQARDSPLTASADIISGVSGGSLGIATFLAAQELPREARLPCIREFLAGDFLSPLLAGLFFLDAPRLIIPTSILDKHRGDYFESFLAKRWLTLTGSDYFYRPLRHRAGSEGHSPVVFYNATDALSGAYIALTPRAANTATPALSALNTDILNRLPGLRIAQAVHMSARFPYLSPTPDLRAPVQEVSRVLYGLTTPAGEETSKATLASLVDGGYFDNSGLWPALRLLESDRIHPSPVKRFILHLVNDQFRSCTPTAQNNACIEAEARSLKDRFKNAGGWLSRPVEAAIAVRAQHSLQSLAALELAQSQLGGKTVVWTLPLAPKEDAPGLARMLLDLIQWLPIHGRDLRYSDVALGWALAPGEREFLCNQAALIRTRAIPGIESAQPVDRSKDCRPALRS